MARYTYTYTCLYTLVAFCVVYTYTAPAPQAGSSRNNGRWERALDSPWGKELQRCKSDWKEVSTRENPQEITRCLHMLLLSIAPKLTDPRGVPAVGVTRFDPLVINDQIALGKPGDVVTGFLKNSAVTGLSHGVSLQASTARYDPGTKALTLTFALPRPIQLAAEYDINLDPAALFGKPGTARPTAGRVSGVADNVVQTTTIFFEQRNGELRVKQARSDFSVGTLKLNFVGARADDALTPLLNTAMSNPETGNMIINMLRPTVNSIVAGSIGALYHRGWRVLEQL